MKLTLPQAEYIASEFQFIKGLNFHHPIYGKCRVDFVEPFKRKSGGYDVMLKNDIYKAPNTPEIFGFVMPKCSLFRYLFENGMQYDLKIHDIKIL